jgi:hypothetical protein
VILLPACIFFTLKNSYQTMKKLFYLAAIVAVATMVACGGKDDE